MSLFSLSEKDKGKECKQCGQNIFESIPDMDKIDSPKLFFKLGYCYDCALAWKNGEHDEEKYLEAFRNTKGLARVLNNPKKRKQLIRRLDKKGLSEEQIKKGLEKFDNESS